MRFIRLVALLLGLSSSTAQAELTAIRLPTAADGEVVFLINSDTKLPSSAFDERAEVTKAALAFLPKKPMEALCFTWQYELRFKTNSMIKAITIEDERGKTLQSLVTDRNPAVVESTWTGQEESHEATKGFLDAMWAPDPWVLLRRITVDYEDGKQSKLHQMVVMTQPMRMELVQKTMEALKTGQ